MGACPFVQHKLREFVENKYSGRIRLVTSSQSWSCIARGAAMRGLRHEPVIQTRYFRDSIGIVKMDKFNELEHHPADKYKCPTRGLLVKNLTDWFFYRGNCPGHKTKVSREYDHIIKNPEGDGPFLFWQDIIGCKLGEADAPFRIDDSGQCMIHVEIRLKLIWL